MAKRIRKNYCDYCLVNCGSEVCLPNNAYSEESLRVIFGGLRSTKTVTFEVYNFVIRCRNRHTVPITKILESKQFSPYIDGYLKVYDENEEYANYIPIKGIGPIINVSRHGLENFVITTKFAEYKLSTPSESYEVHMRAAHEREVFTNTILEHTEFFFKIKPSYPHFIDYIYRICNDDDTDIEGLVVSHAKYIFDKINDRNVSGLHLPFMKELNMLSNNPKAAIHIFNNNLTKSITTPLVNEIYDSLFGIKSDKPKISFSVKNYKRHCKKFKHVSLLEQVKIKKKIIIGSKEKEKVHVNWLEYSHADQDHFFYKSVTIGGMRITIGDFVILRSNSKIQKILRVLSLWQDKNKRNWLHGQIFIKSSSTVLGKIGNSKELFMTGRCLRQELLWNVFSIIEVKKLHNDYTAMETKTHFYRRYYESGKFLDLPPELEKNISCFVCSRRYTVWVKHIPYVKDLLSSSVMYRWRHLVYKGNTYCVNSGIFLKSRTFNINYETPGEYSEEVSLKRIDKITYPEYYRKPDPGPYIYPIPYCTGYIREILTKKKILNNPHEIYIVVNILIRPQNIPKMNTGELDLNMLYWTDETVLVNVSDLVSPCDLSYSENVPCELFKWSLENSNRFYFKSSYDFSKLKPTKTPPHAKAVGKNKCKCNKNEPATTHHTKLKAFDLFSGCGGLSKGLHDSGVIETCWALENEYTAAEAFQLNNEKCTVFVEDCNKMLQDLLNKETHSSAGFPFPKRNEVDVICCGPPCQGFSTLNRFNKSICSKFKNSLVVTALSYCDYYRPKYFILENVRNFVTFDGGIVLKSTIYCLLQLGYQCAFRVIQAGSFGIPQSRRRLIILAARNGYPLPKYPDNTHSFSLITSLNVTVNGERFRSKVITRSAPRRMCTIRDAIGDLPAIENGHENLEMDYTSNPKSDYQKTCRENSMILRDHICTKISPLNLARITRVPIERDADWRDLPNIAVKLSDGTKTQILKYEFINDETWGVCRCIKGERCYSKDRQKNTLIPWFLPHTAHRHNNWEGVIGRLPWDGQFKTTLTNPSPMGKQGRVIHPEQHRIVSVRECARSQGFPDSYIFCGDIQDKYKQIGNAVPPPLARAIGQELAAVLHSTPPKDSFVEVMMMHYDH